MKRNTAIIAVTLSGLLTGCGSAEALPKPVPESTQQTQELRLENLRIAIERERMRFTDVAAAHATSQRGSAQGLKPFLAEDAVLLVGGAYAVHGREAIIHRLASAPLEGTGRMTWTPLRWDISTDLRLGYSMGWASIDTPAADGSLVRTWARYVSAWRRGNDGQWRIVATVRNPSPYTPTAPPAGFQPYDNSPRTFTPPRDTAEVLAEVFAADQAFSALSDASDFGTAFLAFAAPDAVMLAGGGLYTREALEANYSGVSPEEKLLWAPVRGEAASSGDFGYSIGAATFTAPGPEGQTFRAYSKYLTLWRKQPDGTWRYLTDMGNGSPGPHGP